MHYIGAIKLVPKRFIPNTRNQSFSAEQPEKWLVSCWNHLDSRARLAGAAARSSGRRGAPGGTRATKGSWPPRPADLGGGSPQRISREGSKRPPKAKSGRCTANPLFRLFKPFAETPFVILVCVLKGPEVGCFNIYVRPSLVNGFEPS